jgi:thiol:disulfide interchange protein DsbC
MNVFASVKRLLWTAAAGLTALTASAGELAPEYQFLEVMFPDVEITDARLSPAEGFVEMQVGAEITYVSLDGSLAMQGNLYEYSEDGFVNLTDRAKSGFRQPYFDRFGDDESILFAAENPIAEVVVFTDIDCGYCRKLHRQIDEFNTKGISVRYLFFPRSGPATDSWFKAQNVWCADSQQQALTMAKNDELVESGTCDASIVAEHYKVVKELDLTGTPAILLSTGRLVPGYKSPDELLEILQEES